MINKFLKTSDTGIFIGNIFDNADHRHYAIQISIALDKRIAISSGGKNYKNTALAIKPLVAHQLKCDEQKVIVILINPASKVGHLINQHVLKKDIEPFINEWTNQIRILGSKWEKNEIDNLSFLNKYQVLTQNYFANCTDKNHESDKRILSALDILEKHSNEILSLEHISAKVFLSPSRFIHLFKKETGITYRRMQLWLKLMHSLDLLKQTSNLTELAYASGFSDSAHFSRTFKETFGNKPSFFIKNSQFIQF